MSRVPKKARIVVPVDTLAALSREALANRIISNLRVTNSVNYSLVTRFYQVGQLGAGEYGKVQHYVCDDTTDSIAVKRVDVFSEKEKIEEDIETTSIALFETKLLLFLSRYLAVHSPHFIDAYAFELLRDRIHANQAKMTLAMQFAPRTLHTALGDWIEKGENATIFSVVIQTLWAIVTLQRMGISHNDLGTTNILIDDCNAEMSIKHETDYALRTNGVVVKLCDFGVSTQKEYWYDETKCAELSEDCALSHIGPCDPRSRYGSVHGYLFHETPSKIPLSADGIPANFDCTDKNKDFVHALYYQQLTDENRDFVYFCNVLGRMLHDSTSAAACRSYLKAILAKAGGSIIDVVKQVTAPTFICKFYDLGELFDNYEKSTVTYPRLTQERASDLRALLNQELRRKPVFRQIYSN